LSSPVPASLLKKMRKTADKGRKKGKNFLHHPERKESFQKEEVGSTHRPGPPSGEGCWRRAEDFARGGGKKGAATDFNSSRRRGV